MSISIVYTLLRVGGFKGTFYSGKFCRRLAYIDVLLWDLFFSLLFPLYLKVECSNSDPCNKDSVIKTSYDVKKRK